jgi:hypothetical protein
MPTTPTEQHHDEGPRCTHCRRNLFDHELNRWACRPCEDRAAKQIRELPSLHHQLGAALIPGARTSDNGSKVTVSRAAPIPIALAPLSLQAAGGISTALQAIEDSWRTALGWTVGNRSDGHRIFATWRSAPARDVITHAAFIGNNLLWACASYEEIAYDLDSINTLYWQAKNALSDTRPRIIRVTCRAVYDDGRECGERLPVDITRVSVKCRACGSRWGREEWDALCAQTQKHAA